MLAVNLRRTVADTLMPPTISTQLNLSLLTAVGHMLKSLHLKLDITLAALLSGFPGTKEYILTAV